jgi:hypothetical protein
MKETVEGDKIGKVLSSTILASLGNAGPRESNNMRYFLEREVGGSVMSVHLGHSLQFIASGTFLSPGCSRWLNADCN